MARVLVIALAGLAAAYLVACGTAIALQDRLIYRPSADVATPTRPDVSVALIETEDGETLRAWRRAPDPGRATILFLGGNADELDEQIGRWRRIAEHGEGFLALSFRGYSGSTGRPSEAGLNADARAAYDFLIEDGVAPGDIVIHGFSLGSGPAVRLAAERPARALVLEAPYTSIDDVIMDKVPVFPWRPFIRSRFRSRGWIARVDEPILIVHGDGDTVVPFAHAQRLAALAGDRATLAAMPGSDHATLTRDGLYDHIWAFLDGPAREETASCGARPEAC